ncbi:MAG: hypothetical protein LBF72_03275 [Holosporales bacterium]|nr:hypothetical protein [Holosporales bacterium]
MKRIKATKGLVAGASKRCRAVLDVLLSPSGRQANKLFVAGLFLFCSCSNVYAGYEQSLAEEVFLTSHDGLVETLSPNSVETGGENVETLKKTEVSSEDEAKSPQTNFLNFQDNPLFRKLIPYFKSDYDVDLVVTWCNDDDPVWRKKRQYWETVVKAEGKVLDKNGIDQCRFRNDDELKYLLRSVEKYAPWIHKIFLVVDNQLPDWLNLNHPQLCVVNHSDFIPEEFLPTFSSIALESFIPYIPGLSEKFLYANDDMFIGNEVSRGFFFDPIGRPIVRLNGIISERSKHLYVSTLRKAYDLISNAYSKNLTKRLPHHNIDSYSKESFLQCLKKFEKEFDDCRRNKFRGVNDVSRAIVSLYEIINGKGVVRINNQRESLRIHIRGSALDERLAHLLKNRPKLFCLNDTEDTNIKDKRKAMQVLKQYFPERSQFEIEIAQDYEEPTDCYYDDVANRSQPQVVSS